MGIIKFRDYEVTYISPTLTRKNLDPIKIIQKDTYPSWNYFGERGIVIPTANEEFHKNPPLLSEVIKSSQIDRESITKDTKVYISAGCSLAKKEYSKLVTFVQDPILADIVVAPYKFAYRMASFSRKFAIFLNRTTKAIFMLRTDNDDIPCIKGQKFINLYHPDLIDKEPLFVDLGQSADFYYQLYDSLMESECVYNGWILYNKNPYPSGIDEALASKKPFIYEDEFMSIMADPSLNLTKDVVNKINGMLKSSDNDTKSLGLRILSNYSWINYPRIMGYFYNTSGPSSWKNLKVTKSGKIKFMIEFMEKAFYGEDRCDDVEFFNSLKL